MQDVLFRCHACIRATTPAAGPGLWQGRNRAHSSQAACPVDAGGGRQRSVMVVWVGAGVRLVEPGGGALEMQAGAVQASALESRDALHAWVPCAGDSGFMALSTCHRRQHQQRQQ